MKLDAKTPSGPIQDKWSKHKFDMKLVNPSNRRKFKVIVVGTGLAGSSAASSLAEMGYDVDCFCIQDSPRRAHSIAAQGGINAAKNYPNDGDSVWRLFYDTVKGGDYRAREANVYRLSEVANNIIDQCVAQGVPFAREFSGYLANRSFGGAQVERTFYSRGVTGQQLLLGAYSGLMRQVGLGKVKIYPRREMADIVLKDGKARGIIARNLVTGEHEKHSAHAVLICSGGYGNAYYLSTNAMSSNGSAAWKAYKKGAAFANPCFTQIHPTCIPVHGDYQSKLTLMSESLRNDGRIWVPKNKTETRSANDIPPEERDYYLERIYPSFGNLVPRDVASRCAKNQCDEGKGVGTTKQAVYLDFKEAIDRLGLDTIKGKYGNLFDMYHHISGENPYKGPMKIFPAVHYTMGGLWVDYNLMSTIEGCFVLGEANFSDHGANRLGASALMQGLADGYFVIPNTLSNYFATSEFKEVSTDKDEFKDAAYAAEKQIKSILKRKGDKTTDDYHKELGKIMWEYVGMARNEKGLKKAMKEIDRLIGEFKHNLRVPGKSDDLNMELEKALRVSDYLELGKLMALDALNREESCGGHFREESQTPENEALRDDQNFCHVQAYEYKGDKVDPQLHKEDLTFENVPLSVRSYK